MKKLTLLFTAIWTALLLTPSVHAADITLSSSCTLTDAIIAANHDRSEGGCPAGRGADTITLTQDIRLGDELPAITSGITIEGNGYAISGTYRWRIFYNDGGALTIKGLTMTDGYVEGDLIRNADDTLKATADQPFGGAIVNWQGKLSIVNSNFSDNMAEYSGGAIANGGELSIVNSSFSDNSADVGGAIDNWGELSVSGSYFSGNSAEWGGAIYNAGELSISDSSFSDNLAEYHGGAIVNWEESELSIINSSFSRNLAGWGGAITNAGELSISDSAFSGNSADTSSGAIHNWGELSISDSAFSDNSAEGGGVILNAGELISIVSSTFSDNSAEQGGAIVNYSELSIGNSTFNGNLAEQGGAIDNAGNLSIVNSTFSDNSAEVDGAIVNLVGELSIVNSIIAGHGGSTCYSDGGLKQNINNFIQDGSCSPAFKGDPKLGELVVPEDGSPAYFPLLADSPAIDAADAGYCPATDQIGAARPQGAGCDIGAIEYVAN